MRKRMLCASFCLMIVACLPLSGGSRDDWFPFTLPWDDSTSSVTDLSGLLDAPAGKHGFLQVTPDGRFRFENNPARVRFIGAVNVAASNFPANAVARKLANRAAKFGINLIRVHLIDVEGSSGLFAHSSANTLDLDAARLDRMDYFLKCLKDRGIYYNFCIQSGRVFVEGDGVDAPVENGQSKYVTLFNETLIGLQKDFAEKTLKHVNPYTGLAYADDPALASVELTNENSLFLGWLSWQNDYIFADHPDGIGEYYSEELDGLFNEWLSERYGDDAALDSAWQGGGEQGQEIIRNGSFESGLTYWDTYIHAAGGASGTIQVLSSEAHDGAKSARVNVTQAGTAGWHAQIKPKPLTVQRGKDYRLVFFLKADAVHPFEIELLENQTWDWYGSYPFESSTEWTQGELYFTPSKDFTDSFVIQFDFGTTEGVYWLDGVSLVQAAGTGLEEGESIALGNVQRTQRSEIGKHSSARVGDNAAFYFDIEGRYIESLAGTMKQELGIKCPVTFTNNYYGLASIYSQSRADYMDAHFYWDHPSMPNGWSDTDWTMNNRSMLKDPYNSTVNHMPLSRVRNKPLVISEYNHPYPTVYQSEMPALFFAYGGFFDLDGLLYHAYYDFITDYAQKWQDLFFDIAMNPIVMTQFILSVPFREGRIRPALNTVTANYRAADVFNNTKIYQDAALLNLPEPGETTYFLSDGFAHGEFDADQTGLSGALNDPGQVISSSTGELEWDGAKGIFRINNPYWQEAAGFLRNQSIDLETIRIDQVHTTDGEDFAAIHLVAMDGMPIASSRSMVLVTAARLENKGLIWNPERTSLVNRGGEIALCEPVYGSFEFRNASPDSFAVYPLDERGMRRDPLSVTFTGSDARFSLGEKTLWYEIVNAGSGGSSVNPGPTVPERFVLFQNYPNPFNCGTTVEIKPNRTGGLSLSVLDTKGRRIIHKKMQVQGGEVVKERIDLSGFASGVYFVTIESQAGMRAGLKMVMMK